MLYKIILQLSVNIDVMDFHMHGENNQQILQAPGDQPPQEAPDTRMDQHA
jgi:hypothetical protein